MMEYALEEDIPDEFKGGTLEINFDEGKPPKEADENITASSNNNHPQTNGEILDNGKRAGFIFPFTQKITETLRPKAKAENTQTTTMQQLTAINTDTAATFFTFRSGIVETAVKECINELLQPDIDGELVDKYLLTEINLWDSDKERLILLTEKTVVSIKYDFIALKQLEYRRINLEELDNVVIGELVYPSGSLVPRLNGIADGVSSVLQTCLFQGWTRTEDKVFDSFHPRERNTRGVRLMWNKGKPLAFSHKWNPFNDNVPICTLTSHPLYQSDECNEDQKHLYDMNHFAESLKAVLSKTQKSGCVIQNNNIVLQNYLGLSSLIHNRNALGFFKVRGRFSF